MSTDSAGKSSGVGGANRPVNLDLTQFSFPFAAIASITHRITGVILFFALGFLLYWLDQATASPEGFAEVAGSGLFKLLVWLIMCAVAYHFFAGIKHLLLDFHIADTIEGGELASKVSVGLAAVTAVLLGIWIW